MKRLLAAILTLSLLLSPALAAEETDIAALFPEQKPAPAFRDVAEDDWFAPYAEICASTGLMAGTGADAFSPGGQVTRAEALTLAARIHHILNGGDGSLPAAPEDWGLVTLTTADGTVFSNFDSADYTRFMWWIWKTNEVGWLCCNLLPEEYAWAETQDGLPATVTIGGRSYSGTVDYWIPLGGYSFTFSPYTGETGVDNRTIHDVLYRDCLNAPAPGAWYRDAVYYFTTTGLAQEYDIYLGNLNGVPATRWELAQLLQAVAGDLLTPINQITDYPDASEKERDTVLALYNAGILTGVDEAGTFSGDGTLTRAEMAAMAARLVRPELRISAQTPANPT